MNSANAPASELPRGHTAIGVFLLIGAALAFLAGTTLVWRGSALDRIWALNPHAYSELAQCGKTVGIAFLVLAVTLAIAAMGWLKRRRWGWRLAVVIIVTQIVGDSFNALLGRAVQGAIGVTVAGLLLFYITRTNVRSAFGSGS